MVKVGAKYFSIRGGGMPNSAKSTIGGIYVLDFSTDPPPDHGIESYDLSGMGYSYFNIYSEVMSIDCVCDLFLFLW